MKYNLDGLMSPNHMQQINTVLGGKFHQLMDLTDTYLDVDKLTNTFNTEISDTATEVLGKCQSKKKPLITDDKVALCDERRKRKKQINSTSEYCTCNHTIKKAMQGAK